MTEDLPTPPLPEATARTRASGGTAVGGASSRAFQRARAMTAAFSAASIWPTVTSTPLTPGRAASRPRTSRLDLGPQRAAGHGQGHLDAHRAVRAVTLTDAHHPEVDDVVAQLGVDHRPEGLAQHLGVQGHWARGPGPACGRPLRVGRDGAPPPASLGVSPAGTREFYRGGPPHRPSRVPGVTGHRYHVVRGRPLPDTFGHGDGRRDLNGPERARCGTARADPGEEAAVTTTATTVSIGKKPDPVTLTDAATAKVAELLAQEDGEELALRVAVRPGGCSGYSYEMFFDSEVADDDVVREFGTVRVVVDAASAELLTGATLEYSDGLQGAGFHITNPNATRTCGCGSSFS